MEKRNMQSSRRTRKPLVSLYGKAVSLLFALFCVASGQLVKPAPLHGAAEGSVKSRAIFAYSLKPLGNVKLYLENVYCIMPSYGIPAISPITVHCLIDSTYSDSAGYFEFPGTQKHFGSNYIVAKNVSADANGIPGDYISREQYKPDTTDTLVTVYMVPRNSSEVKKQPAGTAAQPLHTVLGKIVTIRIPGSESERKTVSVINVKGETIARLRAAAGEDIRWNTGSVAKGLYLIALWSGKNRLALKIAVH